MAARHKGHIVVVGAGVFGVWTAYWLLEAGFQVTLYDAWGAGHTRASSGGESRILRCVYGGDAQYPEMTRVSLAHWQAFARRWRSPCFQQTGALWLFSGGDQRYMLRSLPSLQDMDWPVEELEVARLPERFPALSADGVERAWWEPQAGHLRARFATEQVAKACRKLGAELRIAAARPGRMRGGRLQEVLLSDGSSRHADGYVFACGPWLRNMFPGLLQEVTQVSRQEVYFFALPPGDDRHRYPRLPIWIEFGDTLYYGLPLHNRRGFKVADDDRSQAFDPDRDDRSPQAWRLERARTFVSQRFPGLAGAPLQEYRVCQYLNSRDGHFIIDRHPEASNLWIVGAGTGHGFKMGPAAGQLASELVQNGSSTEPSFRLTRWDGPAAGSYNQFVVDDQG